MSITDELRKWWVRKFPVMDRELHKDFTAIADRVDAEHEAACAEAYGNGVMSVPIALDESQWVKLPVDADGEVIHVRDKLDGYGKTVTVVEMRYGRSGWVLISEYGNAYADCFAFTHYHAPTVEDVLRDCIANVCRANAQLYEQGSHPLTMEDIGYEVDEYITEYAAKLQLREVDE